ncbi:hypothetical protein KO500_16470 [Cellulophaga baltica]|uniref:hypothetical protein n=1 Tax=Cellulophaga TaxID=104264 RepID=UPI001C06EA24|nr:MULTISPECIES: hypothetical protein [Cellulophaga]MBU2998038.1 hypothetical protein [Cellulophaga baltica]MDO6769439.1 hypothetical protein [Cellulophaga sp. 1_MG-2023]
MRAFLFLLLCSSVFFSTYAHDVKEAYFKIEESDAEILVKAEFPWTIRKAVFKFKPELKNNKSKEAIDNAFFEYVQSNLILKDLDGNTIQLLNIEASNNNAGHSHQSNFTFYFKKATLLEVQNTIMFNLSDSHTNLHSFINSGNSKIYTTSLNEPSFKCKTKSIYDDKLWLLLLLVPVGLFVIFNKRLRTNQSQH